MWRAFEAATAVCGKPISVSPGPFGTGFNERMLDAMLDWWDRATATPEEIALVDPLREYVLVGQLDPSEAANVYADLAEAETTKLVNFIPLDILRQFPDNDSS